MNIAETTTLKLLRYGIFNVDSCDLPDDVVWNEVFYMSYIQGVAPLVMDGINRCFRNGRIFEICFQTKMDWIGEAQLTEAVNEQHIQLIRELALFYNKYGIKMMLLKGVGLSLNYPIPNHRPCGDIDIYLFGEQERADELLETELGIKVDHSHHHHTIFVYHGVTVENHYDFINIFSHRSTKKLENRLKSMAQDAVPVKTKDGTDVWLPSANFNALFVLRHCAGHFVAGGMTLRMILDWGLFIKKYHHEVDWDQVLPIIKELNMHKFLDAVNYICYTYLGFDKDVFAGFRDENYGERVFEDLFNPANMIQSPKGFIKYIVFRFKKWWAARWKHRIVYSDSLLSTFFYQVHAHLMKPATLVNK